MAVVIAVLLLSSHRLSAAQDWSQQLSECRSLEDDDPQQAIDLAQMALAELSQENQTVLYGHFLGCAAWAYVKNNQTQTALRTVLDLERLIGRLADSEEKITLLRRAGGVFHQMGYRIAAVNNYQSAMTMAETLNLESAKIPILINLGVLNSQIREHQQAIDNYQLALDLMTNSGDDRYRPPVLFNLAITLSGEGRYTESLPLLEAVAAMITPQWPDSRVAQIYTGLATAHNALGSHQQALKDIEKTLSILKSQAVHSIDWAVSQVVYAEILIELNQKQAALQQANAAWDFYRTPDHRELLLSINNPLYSLSNVYESLNKPYQALQVRKMAAAIDREFQDSFNKEAMAQMQARLSDSQQRKQLAELKAQQAKNQIELIAVQHNRQFILLLVAFASILVVVFFYWQRLTNKRLHAISIRDSLTQVGNRRAINEWLSARKLPDQPNLRLMWLIDLDLFKQVNDEYGHEAGDEVLKALAKTLSKFINPNRMVARWGGEEFMMISDDITESEMSGFCDGLMTAIAKTDVYHENQHISVTASIGVSTIKEEGDKAWHQALSAADKALYQAKDNGRNCMVCGDKKLSEKISRPFT
ncbi:MAG: diguanylate cyclase [Proteobacteria bacterium]|nr:MAG: diguanylate cyclase [Pseudomonadota bacterium]